MGPDYLDVVHPAALPTGNFCRTIDFAEPGVQGLMGELALDLPININNLPAAYNKLNQGLANISAMRAALAAVVNEPRDKARGIIRVDWF